MIADIFITTCGRTKLFEKSIESFVKCTDANNYRFTVVEDSGNMVRLNETINILNQLLYQKYNLIVHTKNEGLGPSINQALAHIDALKKWDENPSLLTVYIQDDVLYSKGWLERLSQKFIQLEKPLNLGFTSGIECIEHPIRKDIGNGMITKDWLRGTNLLARHSYWMSMWPIPRIDAETGRERGRPHDGLGSGVDWHFMRVHENSVCKTGRTNLVIPGLLQHTGYKDSTWLKRELPESESDKRIIDGRDEQGT